MTDETASHEPPAGTVSNDNPRPARRRLTVGRRHYARESHPPRGVA
ncbi:MAG: hypothetical protein LBS12_06425 [Prevotellaceae bacterium]|nr:hypothetical protein [Prevotellaceae bacterium]